MRILLARTPINQHLAILGSHLNSVFPTAEISFAHCAIPSRYDELNRFSTYPEESPLLDELQAIRRSEFLAGRDCARRAAQQLNVQLGPLTWDTRGVPNWPSSITGSISHKWRLCAAAVAKKENFCSVGLDLELNETLNTDLWHQYCTKTELDGVLRHEEPNLVVNLIFCIKESVYKCLFPIERIEFDFSDVEVSFCLEQCEFQATVSPTRRNGASSEIIRGRFSVDSQWIVAGSTIEPT